MDNVELPRISIRTTVSQDTLDRGSKTILLVNKDIAKLQRLSGLNFAGKKVLVIDDEADVLSRGFNKRKNKVTIAECAKEIEDLRKALAKTESTYLAVTINKISFFPAPSCPKACKSITQLLHKQIQILIIFLIGTTITHPLFSPTV